jgi:hypothetical protein
MTTTTEIPRDTWRSYFEELTTVLGTVEATVEVIGDDGGEQVTPEHHVLTDMAYDDQDDAIVIGLEAPGPQAERRELRVEEPNRVLVVTGEPPPLEVTYDIEDGEDQEWLVRLERPPALPGE